MLLLHAEAGDQTTTAITAQSKGVGDGCRAAGIHVKGVHLVETIGVNGAAVPAFRRANVHVRHRLILHGGSLQRQGNRDHGAGPASHLYRVGIGNTPVGQVADGAGRAVSGLIGGGRADVRRGDFRASNWPFMNYTTGDGAPISYVYKSGTQHYAAAATTSRAWAFTVLDANNNLRVVEANPATGTASASNDSVEKMKARRAT